MTVVTQASPHSPPVTQPDNLVTREEYARLPEGPPYYELIDGRMVTSPSPVSRHSELLTYLIELLGPHARGELGGWVYAELDLYLPDTENIYRPDLTYLSHENMRLVREDAVHGVPDLVCEILSPSTAGRDRYLKFEAYLRAEVPHYWLFEPETVAVQEFVLTADGHYRVQAVATPPTVWSPLIFPGWSLDLGVAAATLPRRSAKENGGATEGEQP